MHLPRVSIPLAVVYLLLGTAIAANKMETKSALTTVTQLQRQDRFDQADAILSQLILVHPKSQRASLFYGLNLRYQKRYDEAVKELQRTIDLKPGSLYAQQAMFIKAKAQHLAGKDTDSLATIANMKSKLPESGWLPQAWVLEAEITHGDIAGAQAKLERQNAGEAIYKYILDHRSEAGEFTTAEAFSKLAEQNDGLPIELASREAAANVLTKTSNTLEAILTFQQLLEEVEPIAPKSRIVQESKYRLAALHHRIGQRYDALNLYAQSIAVGARSSLSESAALQSAGIEFEFVLKDAREGNYIDSERWDSLHQKFTTVRTDAVSTKTKLVIDLMTIEAYLWEGRRPEAVEVGNKFLDDYQGLTGTYPREIATAYTALSRICKEMRNYRDCVVFAEAVLSMYPTQNEIWPRMDHVQRCYYDITEALYSLNQTQEADKMLNDFSHRFPDSDYIKAIKTNKSTGRYKKNFEAYGRNVQ